MEMPENLSGLAAARGPETSAPPTVGGQGGPQQKGQPASAQEQEIYNEFVTGALNYLHEPKRVDGTLKALQTQDPGTGVANVAAAVITKAASDMQRDGKPLPFEVIIHGASEIFDNVAEIAKEAGLVDFDQDQKAAARAYVTTFDTMRVQLQQMGLIDKTGAQAMLSEIQQADKGAAPGQAQPGGPPMAARPAGGPAGAPAMAAGAPAPMGG